MDKLIAILQSISPLSPALLNHLLSIITVLEFKKGDIILEKGKVCNFIYFIEKGLIRSYYMLGQEEVSNWFMKEGNFCISVLSFMRRTPSADILVALEDCVCLAMAHDKLEETYRLFPEYNLHGRIIASEYYCQSEERHMANKRQNKEDKYEQLMDKDPDLVKRVSNKHMASYLNASLRTYTDMRKNYREKKIREAKKGKRSKN